MCKRKDFFEFTGSLILLKILRGFERNIQVHDKGNEGRKGPMIESKIEIMDLGQSSAVIPRGISPQRHKSFG